MRGHHSGLPPRNTLEEKLLLLCVAALDRIARTVKEESINAIGKASSAAEAMTDRPWPVHAGKHQHHACARLGRAANLPKAVVVAPVSKLPVGNGITLS